MKKLVLSATMVCCTAASAFGIDSRFEEGMYLGTFPVNYWRADFGSCEWLSAGMLLELDSGTMNQSFTRLLDGSQSGSDNGGVYEVGWAFELGGQRNPDTQWGTTMSETKVDAVWCNAGAPPVGDLYLAQFDFSDDASGVLSYWLGVKYTDGSWDSEYAFNVPIAGEHIAPVSDVWDISGLGGDVAIADGTHTPSSVICGENVTVKSAHSGTETNVNVAATLTVLEGKTLSVDATNSTVSVGNVSATATGQIVLGDGGVVTGGGTILADLIAEGGEVNPGQSPGTLTVKSLELGAGSTLNLELGLVSDMVEVTGNAVLAGNVNINLFDGFVPEAAGSIFKVVSAGGTLDASGATFVAPAGCTVSTSQDGGDLFVTVAAVPEPGTLFLLAAGLIALAVRRSR